MNEMREKAIAAGASRYFTGKPCLRGHLSERFVRNYECVACKVLADAAYQKANSAKLSLAAKRWKEKQDPAVLKEYASRYYRRHKEKCHAASNKWTRENVYRVKAAIAANAEARRASAKKYKKANPHVSTASFNRRRARLLRAIPPWADHHEIKRIYEEAATAGMHVDHIVPLLGKNVCGLHVQNNLRPLMPVENMKKGNRLIEELL